MSEGTEKEIHQDELFLGLTRPTTVWGVPYTAFIVEVMFTTLLFLAVGDPFYMLLIVPMHFFMYALSATDPKYFEVMAVWLKTSAKCQNSKHWGSVTFSPKTTKKWKQ